MCSIWHYSEATAGADNPRIILLAAKQSYAKALLEELHWLDFKQCMTAMDDYAAAPNT